MFQSDGCLLSNHIHNLYNKSTKGCSRKKERMKLRNIVKNKKANLQDPFWVIAMILGWAIFFIILYFVWEQIRPDFTSTLDETIGQGEESFNVTKLTDKTKSTIRMYNNLFPLILTGLVVFLIISAFFINSHPVFFFISLLLLMTLITLGVAFSNMYQRIIEDSNFAASAADFGIMNLFMEKLTWIILIIFVITAIILFAKPWGGSPSY